MVVVAVAAKGFRFQESVLAFCFGFGFVGGNMELYFTKGESVGQIISVSLKTTKDLITKKTLSFRTPWQLSHKF